MTLNNRIRKLQLHSSELHIWNDRGAPDFSDFDPDNILASDLWRCDVDEVVVNGVEGNIKLFKGDIVVALVDDPGSLTYSSIEDGKWQIVRMRPVGEGSKQTGVDGGYRWEQSFADDFVYICTQGGEPNTVPSLGGAIWKRFQLHST
jgi:hypothetical protein